MKSVLKTLPLTVVILAIVGFLINIATTMIYSQLAMYMKHELGATARDASRLDGIVEAISHITRIASGVVSDMIQNRKGFLVVGYFFAMLAKPLYLINPSMLIVFISQTLDRLGNGIIGSPRDALVGDVTPKPQRGASYGFMRSLKTAGSVVGAALSIWIMVLTQDNYKMIFMIAVIPAFLAFVFLVLFVKEPESHKKTSKSRAFRLNKHTLSRLNGSFWKIICLASFFEIAHFSESLLSWRANDVGVSQSFIAFVMVIMNIGQFLVAYPLGMLSDRFDRKIFLMIGFVFMILANLCMGFSDSQFVVLLGVFFWGAQMSTTQSIFLSMISTEVEKELRGTAFGIFYLLSGIFYLVASEIAGDLWDSIGYHAAFGFSMVIAVIATLWAGFGFKKRTDTHEGH